MQLERLNGISLIVAESLPKAFMSNIIKKYLHYKKNLQFQLGIEMYNRIKNNQIVYV